MGYLCNDGAAALPPENANWPERRGLEALEAMSAEYERESKARANVKFVKGSWDMSAARDLQVGRQAGSGPPVAARRLVMGGE